KRRSHRVHTIMIANCGQLPGGLRFLPQAKINDGLLDIVVLQTQGFFGWFQLAWQMIWQNGIRRQDSAGKKIRENDSELRTLDYLTGASIKLLPAEPMPFELDGDEFGTVERMHCWVEPGGLRVMVR
ncbi:MAG: diacylglycerol kinase, partial [Microbacteriaceae bacterium]